MARAHKPKLLAIALLSAGVVVGASACADPKNDYTAFQTRTNDIRGVQPVGPLNKDGGTSCSTAPAGPTPDYSTTPVPNIEGTYFASCLANLSECDLNKSLRFKNVVKTSNGMVEIETFPLLIGATNTSQVAGPSFKTIGPAVGDGTFTVVYNSGVIPGTANAISQRDLNLTNGIFRGIILTSGDFCAELDGALDVTGVGAISLDGPGDICLFKRVSGDGDTITHTLEDYHCP